MKFKQKILEVLILLLILYSLMSQFLELEFADGEIETLFFAWSEWIVAVIFTVEYFVRWIASRSLSYPLKPLAIVDLLAIVPFYLGFLVDLRSLRLLRGFRVLRLFKLYRYTDALKSIQNAFAQVQYEFGVIGFAVLTLGWICSVAIYELESTAQPQAFSKLSDAAWYTMTTLTTVGYGDKVPVTPGGRCVAVFMMVCGLGLFGTFVSLIGSAFLEELRKNPRRNYRLRLPVTNPDPHVTVDHTIPDPSQPPTSTSTVFHPETVLAEIRTGELGDQSQHARAIQLLEVACRTLLRERTGKADLNHG